MLNESELARGRSYSYRLFGGLFLAGVTAAYLPWIEAVDSLAAVLPLPFDPHEAAAAHHDLFAFHLHPYASLFLDDSGLSGGAVAEQTAAAYRAAHFPHSTDDTAPDHLGQALLFLAFLTEKEAAGEATQGTQQQFLRENLLPWLFPALTAVQMQSYPFYAELSRLTLALVMSHYDAAAGSPTIPLPVAATLIDGRQADLRAMVRYLTTPYLSGVYCGRHDIARLARALNLPRGFGGRETMLLNLFRSGGQYETAVPLLQQLGEFVARWQTAYSQTAAAYPRAASFLQPWQSRAAQTQLLLQQGQTMVNAERQDAADSHLPK